MKGQIVKIISNLYTVKCGSKLFECRARGIFRKDKISPIVGDNVVIDDNNVIIQIMKRKNELKRPVVANVDIAFIVTSVRKPKLDLNLLDKLVTIITYNDIEPVICFTKLDLLDSDDVDSINDLRKYYEMIGIRTVFNNEVDKIKEIIKDKIVVLAGQTGAGKSSLINRLDSSFNVETNEISEALGRGKHTTRHVQLYEIFEGYVADTPGFSALDLTEISKEELKGCFKEFNNYDCKFRDCQHDKEIGCAVKEAVINKEILESRYNNYLYFLKEVGK